MPVRLRFILLSYSSKINVYDNKIQRLSCQNEFGKEHRDIVCVDGELFSQPLWGSEQEKPAGIQRLFGGELQTADRKSPFAGHQQIFGVHQARQTESEVCQSATKEFFGECHQRCRLQVSESSVEG